MKGKSGIIFLNTGNQLRSAQIDRGSLQAETNYSGQLSFKTAGFCLQFLYILKNGARLFQQNLSLSSGLHPFRGSQKKTHAKFLFKRLDMQTDRGLAGMQPFGRTGHITLICNHHKSSDLVKLHILLTIVNYYRLLT